MRELLYMVALLSSSAAQALHAAEAPVDADLLEFLGSVDADDEGWRNYLKKADPPAAVKPVQSPPAEATPPTRTAPQTPAQSTGPPASRTPPRAPPATDAGATEQA
ncbi:MAG: hypothetical protein ACHQAR_04455 [Steroidobacterales bacterium]